MFNIDSSFSADHELLQAALLRRKIVFTADIVRICLHNNAGQDISSLDTILILEDPITSFRSILYYATNRGNAGPALRNAPLPARFEEWDCKPTTIFPNHWNANSTNLTVALFDLQATKSHGSKRLELKMSKGLSGIERRGTIGSPSMMTASSSGESSEDGKEGKKAVKRLEIEFYEKSGTFMSARYDYRHEDMALTGC